VSAISDTQVRKILTEATTRARRSTPRPDLLTWCIRQNLHYRYGWTPYF
jgi:hypothetical protein